MYIKDKSGKHLEVDLIKGKYRYLKDSDHQDKLSVREKNKAYFEDVFNNTKCLSIVIVSTMLCNLRCEYCYENDKKLPREVNFSYSRINDFIKDRISETKCKSVKIAFTGGEPLLNYGLILGVMEYVSKYCDKLAISLDCCIVTNGTIAIDNKYWIVMKEMGLSHVQVSLDGTREVHNKRRPADFDCYERVIHFIDGMMEKEIRVVVRSTIDQSNKNSVEELVCIFSDRYKDNLEDIEFSFRCTEINKCSVNSCNSIYAENRIVMLRELVEEVVELGFSATSNYKTHSSCIRNNINSYVINVEGDLLECCGVIGNKRKAPLSIYNYDTEEYIKMKRKLCLEECFDCEIFPYCMGGCIVQRNTGISDADFCAIKRKEIEELVLNIVSS